MHIIETNKDRLWLFKLKLYKIDTTCNWDVCEGQSLATGCMHGQRNFIPRSAQHLMSSAVNTGTECHIYII